MSAISFRRFYDKAISSSNNILYCKVHDFCCRAIVVCLTLSLLFYCVKDGSGEEPNDNSNRTQRENSSPPDDSKAVLENSATPIICAKFSPDGKQILAGYEEGPAILWDVKSGKRIREFEGKGKMESFTRSVAFHPTNNIVAVGHGFIFLRTVRLYHSSTGKVEMEIPFDLSQGIHQSVEFSPNGKDLLACHQMWSIAKKKPIWGFETCNSDILGIKKQERRLFTPKWGVECTAFTPNGRIVVLGGSGPKKNHYDSHNAFIAICNSDSGKIRSLIKSSEKIDLGSFVKHITCDTHGKKCLVVTYTGLFEMILRTGEVTELSCDINNAEILDAIYGRNKHEILLGLSNNSAVVYDTKANRVKTVFKGHTDVIRCLTLEPKGTNILTGSEDGKLILWEYATGKKIRVFE